MSREQPSGDAHPSAAGVSNGRTRRHLALAWTLAALGVFAIAEWTLFASAGVADPTQSITVSRYRGDIDGPLANVATDSDQGLVRLFEGPSAHLVRRSDQSFVAWVVARNARTWTHEPWHLFDAETCHPTERALALGEPVLSHGLLAAPFWAASHDPLFTVNAIVWLLPLLGAIAMFLLVRDLTQTPAAGIVAGLLYGFSAVRNADMLHFYIYDTSGIVLGILFANRWLATGRWRYALGLAAAITFQIGGSLYPLIAAVVIAPPLFAWMLVRHGAGRTHWLQWLVVVGLGAGAGFLVFEPYLTLRASGGLETRGLRAFAAWRFMFPGGPLFAGWTTWLLATVAFATIFWRRLRQARCAGTDRALLAVLIACAAVLLVLAAGGNAGDRLLDELQGLTPSGAWPNPYALIERIVPGLGSVRAPLRVHVGVDLLLSLLAGLGTAAMLRSVPGRWAPAAAAIIVAIVFVDTLRPEISGLPSRIEVLTPRVRPAEDTLDLYRRLAEDGPGGPIFEAPFGPLHQIQYSETVLLSAYHHQRTSACASSYRQAKFEQMQTFSAELPSRDAVEGLCGLGFRSFVVHHADGVARSPYAVRFARTLAEQQDPGLVLFDQTSNLTAYVLATSSSLECSR